MRFEPRTPREGVNYSLDNPLREVAIMLVAVVAITALVFVSLGQAIEFAVPLISPRWEMRVFGGLGRYLDSEGFARADPEIQELADRIASRWPDCPYVFRVLIDESPDPNAFAVPGGQIVLTRGLLEQAESENELAFVLGHEIGHFRGRDHLRGIGRSAAFLLFGFVVRSSMGLGDVQGLALTQRLTESRFSRMQESSADLFGLTLVHAEYGHLAGALDFFRRDEPGRSLASWMSTHPASDDRISDLEGFARQSGWGLSGETEPSLP